MEESITIEEFVKTLRFEDIVYKKDGEHDHIHTLMPLESNNYFYALQANENKYVKYVAHTMFSSFDQDGNFDVEYFLDNLELEYNKEDYSVSQEYLMSDFLTSSVVGASKDFSRVMQEVKINKANHISYITMGRLTSTFQSAAILIKNGFYYETKCLFRVILEQISYSYQCSKSDDENVDKLKPQASISELKKIFENAGMLNGLFSNFIHHNRNIWGEFLDEELYIMSRSGIRSKTNVVLLAFLAEMYVVVLYDIYKRLKGEGIDELFHGLVITNVDIIEKVKSHFRAEDTL